MPLMRDDLAHRLADAHRVDEVGQAAAGEELEGLVVLAGALVLDADAQPGHEEAGPGDTFADRSKSTPASGSKISRSGQKRTRVPVFLVRLTFSRLVPGLEAAVRSELSGDAFAEAEPVGPAVAVDLGDELRRTGR